MTVKVNFGDKVKDKVTEFEGIAYARHVYLSGCTQIMIVPQINKEGKKEKGDWFDEQRLMVIQEKVVEIQNPFGPGHILLGDKVKDKITGFEGIAYSRCIYMAGEPEVLVIPGKDKDGKKQDSEFFQESRLVSTEPKKVVLDNGKTPGCDKAGPLK